MRMHMEPGELTLRCRLGRTPLHVAHHPRVHLVLSSLRLSDIRVAIEVRETGNEWVMSAGGCQGSIERAMSVYVYGKG